MSAFTPWTLFVDLGIVAALLLVGKFIRVKVKAVQKMFIPPSLIAGFLGLLLGPEGLGWLPFSGQLGTYAGILIALVFACLPFTSAKVTKEQRGGIGKMWAYSQGGMLFQWAFGGFLGVLVLCQIWPLDKAFGISMPCGFCGGHGTAAAIGTAFQRFGNEEMLTLAMTAATVGILGSVLLGMLMIKWATRKGHTSYLSDFSALPDELRTGLLPEDKRENMGESSCSSISIDGLAFNLAVVVIVAFGGYLISKGVNLLFPTFELPVFSCAFIVGILVKLVMDKANVTQYVCKKTVGHLSGTFTDFLVAFGISSIKLSVVANYIVPLSILLVCGLLFTLAYVFCMGRRMFKGDGWFEKSVFTWGWYTGTMAMGIALLRVVDHEMKSRCLDDYALAYLFIAPVEIALITFAPVAFVNGYGVHFLGIVLAAALVVIGVAAAKGWLKKR